ncbi:GntR family transcriptional regulator [Xylanimonas ulmi]|uniref:GntR family transcriptional regulator n=1 Tax=Xylanimonas ulmi TaxID=228973 RepID=A0A4Q7M3F3_9MICO|nr:GntR family transcriptional regulator [Xylanibacterium ulmi]RZS62445.1 GntR family transcriptional regulator [Xylanibacterium ulmi]
MPTLATGARPEPRTSGGEVREELRRRIVSLDLAPGSPISINALAASLGVSRTPVRESLIRLADEGLVQVFPKVGTFVSRIDPQRVSDAQFLREAVELASLASLATQGPPDAEAVAALRRNVQAQHEVRDGVEDFLRLDDEFHRGLLDLAGNGGVWDTVATAKVHLDRARRLGLRATPLGAFVAEHDAILEAVCAGDLDRAARQMRAHLRAVFTDIDQIRARSPQLFRSQDDAVPVRRNIPVWS